ncbi:C2 family cysteine protease [Calothrix sp. PCC 7507]|uniref:C2 family cysteine protease n=1 Tax=Calothrix sp. PCC 7507 TaxID=99598 RepID=UPI00029F1CB5|nr:C2 family cysteine protease [Calothrix sp. PCC 7507]AFY31972.1 peptidase C2 calpain [Calothrix sp. PCC 7507]
MTFNTDNATDISIPLINPTYYIDVISPSNPNPLKDSGFASDSNSYQIPDNLCADIPLIQNPDYLAKTALLSTISDATSPPSADPNSPDSLAPEASNSGAGTDQLGVPVPNNNTNSNPLSSSPPESVNDWFSSNLLDQQLIAKTRNLFADGNLSRNDVIAIFRDAEDGSVIDTNEYKDLQKIVSNYSYFNMDDYVHVLSSKVVFGTSANASYQGKSLGNLYAGSSSSQMENLIGKWFLGSDRPSTSYTYKPVEGSLFQNGVSYQDISQGNVGDCYFLAGLAEVAIHSPSTIESMFIDNGDSTYTVRFYNRGVADYVTVDKYLPVDSDGDLVYANQAGAKLGKYYENNELWTALAEKAYAQINESGWIAQDNTNSYAGISAGWDMDAIRHITGKNSGWSDKFDLNSLVSAYNAGTLMGISSKADGVTDSRIVPNHVYVVVDYNSSTQQFTLFNPWGIDGAGNKPGTVQVSINLLQTNFYIWSYTT